MEHLIEMLDSQLRKDCHPIFEQGAVVVLLHRNALLPWFILVPLNPQEQYRELFELPDSQRRLLMRISDVLSGYLLRRFACEKINLAAIGNLVPQFHWHVVGRKTDDALWPAPLWGNLGERFQNWSESELQDIRQEVQRLVETLPDEE